MPYKEFEPRDTLEEAMSKLWGAAQEFVPTTRLEEIICMIANAQPTGIHAVPDIGENDEGKVLTVENGEAVWAEGGGGGGDGLASEMFPFAAHVSYVETGLPTGNAAMFTGSLGEGFEGLVVGIKDDTYDEITEWVLTNGEYDIALLGTEGFVDTDSGVAGVYLEYNPAVWSVTVSGNAEVLTGEGTAAVFVKGDCTINAGFIGT